MNPNNIYFLYPPISKFERYSSAIGNAGGEQIPLGIYYLAAFLRENNFNVMATDAESEKLTLSQIRSQIKKFDPKYVGISSTTVSFHRALEVAKDIKKNIPGILIILGGSHVTSNVNQAMAFDEFDFGVIGEGELTLLELIKCLNEKKMTDKVNGIAYKMGKEVIVTNPRKYIDDLDSLPFPAYDLIKNISLYTPPPSNYKALPVINMITGRGCPNQCTFCDRNIFGNHFRELSAERVVEEIKYLWDIYHFKEIAFLDDTFLINKNKIAKIFSLLEKENISFYWTCMSRVNIVDYQFLKYIKSKGCWHISFGIESGDEEILRSIKKNISIKQVTDAINWCHDIGIKTKGFFIIGHPKDTVATINKTIDFACKLKLDDIVTTLNTPFPGSTQFQNIKEFGKIDDTDWSKFNCWSPVFIPNNLTREELLFKQKEMYRKFYLRPRIILRYFFSFFGKGGKKRFISIFKASRFIGPK